MRHKLDNLVRPIAEDEVRRLNAQLGRQFVLKVKRVAVRVQVALTNGGFHCLDGERARAKRVFVRGNLDDFTHIEAKFAGDLIDRATWLVYWQGIKRGVEFV